MGVAREWNIKVKRKIKRKSKSLFNVKEIFGMVSLEGNAEGNGCCAWVKDKNKGKRKIYLNIPYTQRNNAKKMGALWDPNKKKWFIYENNKNKGNLIGRFSK